MNSLMQKITKLRDLGELTDLDVAFSRFLKKLQPDVSETVLMAAIMTTRAFREGDVCFSLQEHAGKRLFDDSNIRAPELEKWVTDLSQSSLIGEAGSYRPLILDKKNRLYLHKQWKYEQNLAQSILERVDKEPAMVDHDNLDDGLQRFFGGNTDGETNWQKIAAIAAVRNAFTVISGGPGTGKTTTVVKILALLLEQTGPEDDRPTIALAAPTGKAAARLEESVVDALDKLETSDAVKHSIPVEAITLHQLLGARRDSSTYRFNENNPLPYDIVVIDEASMIDQSLMNALMQALLMESKLILIGDKDQLASVEAGSVIGSICAFKENGISTEFSDFLSKVPSLSSSFPIEKKAFPLTDHVLLLKENFRFRKGSGIPELAAAINSGEEKEAWRLMANGSYNDIEFEDAGSEEGINRLIKKAVDEFYEPICSTHDTAELFMRLKQFAIFSPHRKGPLGVEDLNRRVRKELIRRGVVSKYSDWYHGKPIIINRNDYTLGLNNGEIGICIEERSGEYRILFQRGKEFRNVAPSRLAAYEEAYALTVHKSQGSEFEEILLFLPGRPSPILSRELLYTAVTRARNSVRIAGTEEVLMEGIQAKLRRTSGLQDLLWRQRTN